MKKITLLFCMVMTSLVILAAPKKVAVYVEGNLTKSQKSIVNSSVLARMSGNKDYAPYERNEDFLRALTREEDYQLSGEVPEKEIRAVGERLGVDYVIVVNAVSDGDKLHVAGRLIELSTGAIIKSVNQSRDYEDSSTITALVNNVAYRLLNKNSK